MNWYVGDRAKLENFGLQMLCLLCSIWLASTQIIYIHGVGYNLKNSINTKSLGCVQRDPAFDGLPNECCGEDYRIRELNKITLGFNPISEKVGVRGLRCHSARGSN